MMNFWRQFAADDPKQDEPLGAQIQKSSASNDDFDFFESLSSGDCIQKPSSETLATQNNALSKPVEKPSLANKFFQVLTSGTNQQALNTQGDEDADLAGHLGASERLQTQPVPRLPSLQGMDKRVLDMLSSENQNLKALLKSEQKDKQLILEKVSTLKLMESETNEKYENCLFEIASLKAELSMQGPSNLVQTVEIFKKNAAEQKHEISQLRAQLELAQNVLVSDQQTQTELEDIEQSLSALRKLYQQFKIKFTQQDELNVLKAIYTSDRPVIRLYRELLFQKVAARAIQSSEFLLAKSGGQNGEARVFVENKRLSIENERLKREVSQLSEQLANECEDRQFENAKNNRQLSRVTSAGHGLQATCEQLRQNLGSLKQEYHFAVQALQIKTRTDLDSLREKVTTYTDLQSDQQESLAQQHNDLYQENMDLMSGHKKMKSESETEIARLQGAISDLEEEAGERQEMITHLDTEMSRYHEENSRLENELHVQQKRVHDLTYQLSDLDQKNFKLSGGSLPPEVEGMSLCEAAVIMAQQRKQLKDLKIKLSESEKMLQDRYEEIDQLLADINQASQKKQNHLQIDTETSPNSQLNYCLTIVDEENSQNEQTEGLSHLQTEFGQACSDPPRIQGVKSCRNSKEPLNFDTLDRPQRQLTESDERMPFLMHKSHSGDHTHGEPVIDEFFQKLVQPQKQNLDLNFLFDNQQDSEPLVKVSKADMILQIINEKLAPSIEPTSGKLSPKKLEDIEVDNKRDEFDEAAFEEDESLLLDNSQNDDLESGPEQQEEQNRSSKGNSKHTDSPRSFKSQRASNDSAQPASESAEITNESFPSNPFTNSFATREVEAVQQVLNQMGQQPYDENSCEVGTSVLESTMEQASKTEAEISEEDTLAHQEENAKQDSELDYEQDHLSPAVSDEPERAPYSLEKVPTENLIIYEELAPQENLAKSSPTQHEHNCNQQETALTQQSQLLETFGNQRLDLASTQPHVIEELDQIEKDKHTQSLVQMPSTEPLIEDPFHIDERAPQRKKLEMEETQAIQTIKDFADQQIGGNDTAVFSPDLSEDVESASSKVAKFNEDPLLLKTATYGQIRTVEVMEQKIRMQFGRIPDEPTDRFTLAERPDPSLEEDSSSIQQSFDFGSHNSLFENSQLQSLKGSLIAPNDSIGNSAQQSNLVGSFAESEAASDGGLNSLQHLQEFEEKQSQFQDSRLFDDSRMSEAQQVYAQVSLHESQAFIAYDEYPPVETQEYADEQGGDQTVGFESNGSNQKEQAHQQDLDVRATQEIEATKTQYREETEQLVYPPKTQSSDGSMLQHAEQRFEQSDSESKDSSIQNSQQPSEQNKELETKGTELVGDAADKPQESNAPLEEGWSADEILLSENDQQSPTLNMNKQNITDPDSGIEDQEDGLGQLIHLTASVPSSVPEISQILLSQVPAQSKEEPVVVADGWDDEESDLDLGEEDD